MDPLAEDYYPLSPYNYVANNPLKYIDPNGMSFDEWDLNKKGETVKHIENKTEDSFHIVDDNGDRIEGKSISFEYRTITDTNQPNVRIKYKDGTIEDKTLTLFSVKGDENAKRLFEFMANPYNTSVEWTHAKIGSSGSQNNIIGSSNDFSSTAAGHYLRLTNYTLKEVNHNHPSGKYYPSDGDRDGASKYKESNLNVKLNIYTHPGKYSEYNEKGTLDFSNLNMPGVTIISPKK